ncbi:MAG: helix-turn-helix transcriptional regulator [Rhodocyclaceae bacterium]
MPNQTTQARLIPLRPDVQSRTCLGKSRIYELIAAGEFPQPVRLGRRIAFVEQEIDAWILQRMAERVKAVAA